MPEYQQTKKTSESKSNIQKQTSLPKQIPTSHPGAIIQRARINPKSLTHADVMQLQRTIGNRAVVQLFSEIGLIPSKAKQTQPVQMQTIPEEEEKSLQGKFAEPLQRQEIPEDEEPLQGKFESIIQRKIKIGETDKEYTFGDIYDNKGNPYLTTKNEDNEKETYQINSDVNQSMTISKVNTTAIDVDEDLLTGKTPEWLYKNLERGRTSIISYNGTEYRMEPFRSYIFGRDTEREAAMWEIDGPKESGPAYKDYYNEMMEVLENLDVNSDNAFDSFISSIEAIIDRMRPLILIEDYRCRGAKNDFERIEVECLKLFKPLIQTYIENEKSDKSSKKKEAKRKEVKREIERIIYKLTIQLPWAGDGGKKKYSQEKNGEKPSKLSELPPLSPPQPMDTDED